jgi:hypothetical protein
MHSSAADGRSGVPYMSVGCRFRLEMIRVHFAAPTHPTVFVERTRLVPHHTARGQARAEARSIVKASLAGVMIGAQVW